MDDADDARTNARTRYKAALDVRSKEKLEASKADTASHHELDSESDVPQHNGDARERLRMGSDQFLSLIQRAERISKDRAKRFFKYVLRGTCRRRRRMDSS